MRPRIDLGLGLAACLATASVACGPPSPDSIFLHTVETGVATASDPPTTLQEGDLVVIDAKAEDGDEDMELCIDTSVSSDDVVRVSRVRGSCRRYVVVATAPGTATIRFETRGTAAVLVLNVTPSR